MATNKSQGKIIAIVGGPRSGKSFLARKLAAHFNAKVFFEGEEGDFPPRILEDIAKNIRPLERILWFRTMFIERYLGALKLKEQGYVVILDVFWITVHTYIDVLLQGFERELMWEVALTDRKMLEWPDLTIFLKASETSIRKFSKLGGRSFESDEFIREQILPIKKMNDEFFAREEGKKILTIERDELDFQREDHFKELATKIEEALNA